MSASDKLAALGFLCLLAAIVCGVAFLVLSVETRSKLTRPLGAVAVCLAVASFGLAVAAVLVAAPPAPTVQVAR